MVTVIKIVGRAIVIVCYASLIEVLIEAAQRHISATAEIIRTRVAFFRRFAKLMAESHGFNPPRESNSQILRWSLCFSMEQFVMEPVAIEHILIANTAISKLVAHFNPPSPTAQRSGCRR